MKVLIKHINHSYGSVQALSDFTIDLTPGIYALLGPNGSGKSTLINIITGSITASAGQILYQEDERQPEDILKMGIRFREKLGFMPQYPGMYSDFTVERFMKYMSALKGITKHEANEQITKILEQVELNDVRKRRIKTLSGGMKQRLALAQAVLGNPEILILDEPTAGLDPKQRISIRNFISEISLNKIVIIATHIVSDVEFIAKRVIMLRKGVVVDNASPNEMINKISGSVWKVICSESEIEKIQNNFRITNIGRDDESGGAVLRIVSKKKPTETAVTISPTLEDYYLYIFGTT
mgnify:FL=1